MKKCRVCGERVVKDAWYESLAGFNGDICGMCTQEKEAGDFFGRTVRLKTELAECDKCGEISSCVKLTKKGWLCGECEG